MQAVFKIYRAFFSKVLIALLLFTICRILFYAFNYRYFNELDSTLWLGGLRYDWMTISILYMPFALAFLFFHRKQYIAEVLFQLSTILAVLANTLDLEYFKFTFKRTTSDLFTTKGIGSDISSLAPQFLTDYWYLLLIAILLIWGTFKLYSLSRKEELPKLKFIPYLLFALPTVFIWGVGFRGGFQYKPLSVMQASQYTKAANIPLVVNTPFTLIKTFNKKALEPKRYFDSKEELNALFNPIRAYETDTASMDSLGRKENVVLFILESFSKEYIGALSGNESYTPFLDSLIEHSLVFENSYANGKKSIEALPAILSSIPSLMNNSYISGEFGSNRIQSLASVLKKQGYSSSFYHGGANGTMGFDAFAKIAAVDEYVGLNEYPNDQDHDGNWGIYDEPFLQFTLSELNKKKEPFLASIFTLSSHHPYPIPKEYKGKFPKGELPILESIAYADHSLKNFFSAASKEDWFDNTLFIFTADHTAQNMSAEYGSRVGIYSIPMIFYKRDSELIGRNERLTQQADIFPSVIDYLNITDSLFAIGNSVFDEESSPFAINFINDTYQLIEEDLMLEFDGEQSIALYRYKLDPILENNLVEEDSLNRKQMERRIKAIIQQYQEALISNRLTP